MSLPVVSICIVTFQHVRFIGRAIEGALMQKTDFPFEILVGEDESTDGTREICQDYAERYPGKVRVFLRSRRDVVHIDGRPRGSYNFRMTLREAKGEFIALCEGDDYWTDPEKLQRQVEYLRANPDCVGCFHDAQLVDAEERTLQQSYFQSTQEKFNQQGVLETLLSREPTCSLLFRKTAFAEPLPDWYLRRPCDLYLDILISGRGLLGFINRNMAAYRRHSGGIWSGERMAHQVIELIIRYKLLLQDPFFTERYGELILRKIDEFQASLFTRDDAAVELRRLETVVAEQRALIATVRKENDRLETEASRARAEQKTSMVAAQGHIDQLRNQLDRLAATAEEQTNHIARLTQERDFSAAATVEARAAEKAAATKAQAYIDDLSAQLDRLAATSRTQLDFITQLTAERDRSVAAAVEARAAEKAAATKAQAYIDDLSAQLDRLAATSRTQNDYIAILQRERDRSESERADQAAASMHYLAVIEEQNKYIANLKAQLQPKTPA